MHQRWTSCVTYACIALLAAPAFSLCAPKSGVPASSPTITSRRDALFGAVSIATGGVMSALSLPPPPVAVAVAAETEALPSSTNKDAAGAPPYAVYGIQPDASAALSPTLNSISPSQFLDRIALINEPGIKGSGGAVWLGEHHNSRPDHSLQAYFIRSVYEKRKASFGTSCPPMAIGLEQVQRQFQPVLDEFISGGIGMDDLRDGVQWDKRWVWPFEVYKGVFAVAQELDLPLIALNVDSEDLGPVERAGYPALSRDQIRRYIKDPVGFAAFAEPRAYKTYVDYVIRPSYDLHKNMSLLRTTITGQSLEEDMPFRNFFSGRILWDEAMASAADDWTSSNPGGLLIGLVGADHIKFRNGVPGRYLRMAGMGKENVSIILNPTLIDTRPSGSVSNEPMAYSSMFPEMLTLQLRYLHDEIGAISIEVREPKSTGGVLPLADYIVVGSSS